MQQIDITADELVRALLRLAERETVCILDSCGVGHLGSHLLIAGIEPVSVNEISEKDTKKTLSFLDRALSEKNTASIFTISYDYGKKLQNIGSEKFGGPEPDVFLARFDSLIIHDYNSGITRIVGDARRTASVRSKFADCNGEFKTEFLPADIAVHSNFSRAEYLSAIETIKERIRQGDTYQTNLTQQLSAELPAGHWPEIIFHRLRRDHPAPFAAFIKRLDSTVISVSPERFFHLDAEGRKISTSPIKGTRPRGETAAEDEALRRALVESEKDRAENTMIVDLLRNDLGRICEYGSIHVEKLCELEEHPTLFHLVSTISGNLRNNIEFSEILKAVFPCGSITGAPKISTMDIIDGAETVNRGLSMGAIGYYIPEGIFGRQGSIDLSVAIRTMVVRNQIATFNVGGGVVIDSDPASEYEETLTKAKSLLTAIGGHME